MKSAQAESSQNPQSYLNFSLYSYSNICLLRLYILIHNDEKTIIIYEHYAEEQETTEKTMISKANLINQYVQDNTEQQ